MNDFLSIRFSSYEKRGAGDDSSRVLVSKGKAGASGRTLAREKYFWTYVPHIAKRDCTPRVVRDTPACSGHFFLRFLTIFFVHETRGSRAKLSRAREMYLYINIADSSREHFPWEKYVIL